MTLCISSTHKQTCQKYRSNGMLRTCFQRSCGRGEACSHSYDRVGQFGRRVLHVQRVGAVSKASAGVNATTNSKRFELDTQEAKKTIQLAGVQEGKDTVIVIGHVESSSQAWEAGLRPGHKVVGISDPNNADQVWELNAMASLRFCRDALRMRMHTLLVLEVDTSTVLRRASAVTNVRSEEATDATEGASNTSVDVLDSVLGMSDSESEPQEETVAERLEREYQKKQSKKTRVQQRIEARKDALEEVGERNDGPFFAAVAAAFFLPPLLILLWAFSSGYLDSLAGQY